MDEALLRRFSTLLERDSALKTFAESHRGNIYFKQTDSGQEMCLWLADGQVSAGPCLPAGQKADVFVYLKAEVFEGLMSGKVNGFNAAMNGKIRVEGDTARATELIKIQKDLARVYALAKSEEPV